jgi:hypothetical protein
VYRITTDEESGPQVEALPASALAPFAEVRAALEVAPWSGDPYHRDRPDTALRSRIFGPDGEGLVVYLILDDQRRVDLLVVLWSE